MAWTVIYHPGVASDDLPHIPANQRRRIKRAIESRLGTEPARYGDRLRKDLAGAWKLRVGDYRIIFDQDADRKEVCVLLIAHRREVHRLAGLRRR